ncbi:MAG: hypothetical protein L6Q57_02200 [Alphaproteobacteria bacterium]|nr:hypothetical protein [Alphaproteobacteria bacterium]
MISYAVFINKKAGTALKLEEDVLRQKLQDALQGGLKSLHVLEPDELQRALRQYNRSNPVLIGGGDGTIASAAAHFRKTSTPFGILPMGTMNLFARYLGIANDFEAAARLYPFASLQKVDTGNINGQMFLCNVMLGIAPELARVREENRGHTKIHHWLHWGHAVFKKLATARSTRLILTHKGSSKPWRGKALVIANNSYKPGSSPLDADAKTLQQGELGVYLVNPHGALESVGLITKLMSGQWQDDKTVEHFETKALVLESSNRETQIVVDGELRRMKYPLIVLADPQSLNVLVPSHQPLLI